MSNDKNRSITDSESNLNSNELNEETTAPIHEATTDQQNTESLTENMTETEKIIDSQSNEGTNAQPQVEKLPEEKVDAEATTKVEEASQEELSTDQPEIEIEPAVVDEAAEEQVVTTEEVNTVVQPETDTESPMVEKTNEEVAEIAVVEEVIDKPELEIETPASDKVAEVTETPESETEDASSESNELKSEATPASEVIEEEAVDVTEEVSEHDDHNSHDEHADDDHDDDHSSDVHLDLSEMGMEELLSAAESSLNLTPREALKRLSQIRLVLGDILRTNRRVALEKFVEEGGEPDAFVDDNAAHQENFNLVYNQAKDARQEERERIDKQKITNLILKKEILEKLNKITESDETEKSLSEVKELQQEWKKIRIVPADKVKELWDGYHFYLNKFYDNHSINIELKELDRKKNLEVKIDLCKKVDELSKENSLKRSFILLNKYQEEFRNTGPVPREYNKEIWERFQQACDKLYEQKKVLFAELEEVRTKNLALKEVLVEKAILVGEGSYKKLKEWKDKSSELDALMEEWKKIGPVPKSVNESVWKKFRGSFNTFYQNKSHYFKEIHKERKANLILKEDICKRAEEIKDSEDFALATNELIKLQKEWKEIGAVPEKVSNAIWRRFRKACDEFFERKNKKFASKREEESKNLEVKKELITRLNVLHDGNDSKDLLDKLKEIQKTWNQVGYIPIKQKKSIESQYHKASDKVFAKFKLDRQSLKAGQMKDHYKHLAELPSGDKRLNDEEYKIKKKIGFLNGEMSTLENNMEFFGRSSGSQKLKKEIEEKIQKMRSQVDRLKAELKTIRGVQEPAAPKTEPSPQPAEDA
jgi:Domain of Unknown Function (DUF349)